MARTVDAANRARLLDRVLDDALVNGIGALSLRPLAGRIGVSAAALLYTFGSKDELTIAVLKRASERERDLFDALHLHEGMTIDEVCRNIWHVVSAVRALPLFRLFFECYGIALGDPRRFPDFFDSAIEHWVDFIGLNFERFGCEKQDARIRATVVLAGFRGFLLDLCATGDYARIDHAVERWLPTLRSRDSA